MGKKAVLQQIKSIKWIALSSNCLLKPKVFTLTKLKTRMIFDVLVCTRIDLNHRVYRSFRWYFFFFLVSCFVLCTETMAREKIQKRFSPGTIQSHEWHKNLFDKKNYINIHTCTTHGTVQVKHEYIVIFSYNVQTLKFYSDVRFSENRFWILQRYINVLKLI